MALCRIKIHYPNSENWNEGDVVEISNPTQLIKEGKVELYVEPVQQEKVVTEIVVEPVVKKVMVTPKKKSKKSK